MSHVWKLRETAKKKFLNAKQSRFPHFSYHRPLLLTFIPSIYQACHVSTTSSPPKITLGILRESKSVWERRAPVFPDHVATLVKDGAQILVQPSSHRVFSDSLFQKAGAKITEDLSTADIILGIKEVPSSMLLPNKTYFFFSHTHKGQPKNMQMLREIIDKKITLIDYELITDVNGKRKVAFGTFAGYAGMIDGLHSLGRRMLGLGYSSPFLQVAMAHAYPSLSHARKSLEYLGNQIKKVGVPSSFSPFVATFTGNGKVASGAISIFNHLPHQRISVEELPSLFKEKKHDPHVLYTVHAKNEDYLSAVDPPHAFNEAAYRNAPHTFQSSFHRKLAPYTSLLVTGHFWNVNYPRIITTAQAQVSMQAWKAKNRMLTIADISCDIEGGIEFLKSATSFDKPWIIFDPITQKYHENPAGEGIQLMAIDILPSELPIESSTYFSEALLPYLKLLVQGKVAPEMKRATITSRGKLEPQHEWLEKELSKTTVQDADKKKHVVILGSGYVVEPALDYLLRISNVTVTIATNNVDEAKRRIHGKDLSRIRVQKFELDTNVKEDDFTILIGADVVVSLLPATLHPVIAEKCISLGTSMVTASYVSPAMKALDMQAKQANVVLLNEIGLDPGLDHLSAKRFIDSVTSRGGHVTGYSSWCGGLPAPIHSDNPFGYKFSWSPLGALKAALNPSRYRMNGKLVEIPQGQVLKHAVPLDTFRGFSLQSIPNRDALAYQELYGLAEPLHTLFRGTLRYPSYAAILDGFVGMGLMAETPVAQRTPWPELVCRACGVQSVQDVQVPQIVRDAMQWLGMFDTTCMAHGPTILDSLCALLQTKLQYQRGEQDMVLMHHVFTASMHSGAKLSASSTLCVYGDPEGYSAMAKTVGLPVGIAAELLLQNRIQERGVVVPFSKDIYEPMLALLEKEGIVFNEKEIETPSLSVL